MPAGKGTYKKVGRPSKARKSAAKSVKKSRAKSKKK